MLKKPVLTISILTMIVFIGTGVLLLNQHQQQTQRLSEPSFADGFMENAVITKFNPQGKIEIVLHTPKMIHFPLHNSTDIDQPNFLVYGKMGPPWHVTSEFGHATDGIDQIQLQQNVVIHQPKGELTDPVTIKTAAATFFPHTQQADTKAPVTIIRPKSIVKGVGLHANMKTGTVKLLSQTEGYYDPQK